MLLDVTVTVLPTAFRVSDCGALVEPSITWPKFRLEGPTLRPEPVPERFAVESVVVPLLSERVPEALPVKAGVRVTEKVALFPEGIVRGKAIPLSPNPGPVIVSPVIVTSPPVAVSVV